MPRRRKYRRRRKKRHRKRSTQILRVPGVIMPDSAIVTLKFNNNYVEAPGDDDQTFNLVGNGLFDPDLTKSAGRPGGFSQWLAFFEKYEVISSHCYIQITNFVNNPMRISLTPKLEPTFTGTISSQEQRYVKSMTVGIPNNSTSTRSLSSSMNTRKLYGRNTDSVNFLGSSTSNPANLWYWQFNALGMKTTSSPDTDLSYSFMTTISYRVKFSKRLYVID